MATISSDILASYAADAAREVAGVRAYLGRMAKVEPDAVDVLVDEIGPA